jgi:sortase A
MIGRRTWFVKPLFGQVPTLGIPPGGPDQSSASTPPTLPHVKQGGRWGIRIGGTLFGIGVLLIAFVAYQLWGTALYTSHAQDHLRNNLARQLHRPLPNSVVPAAASSQTKLPSLASRTAASTPDPPANSAIGLLSIPNIGLNDAIVEGVGEGELEQGPGHYPGTPLPGQPGNVAIAGHRTTYAHPFYNLDQLAPGNPIYILTKQGLFRYKVTGTQVVAPNDTAVLDSMANRATLTLTTCNPRYSATTRMVVTAAFDPGLSGGATDGTISTSTIVPPKSSLSAIPGDALTGATNSLWPAVLWSALALLLGVALWYIWRRSPRRLRWLVVLVGTPVVLIGLLVSFEHISLALPGSF